MSTREENTAWRPTWNIGQARIALGLAQGLALYLLYMADDSKTWPATDGLIFAPLLFVSLFVPIVASLGIGNLRPRTLAVWVPAAAIIVAALASYGIWHELPGDCTYLVNRKCSWTPYTIPAFGLFVFTTAGLFIAHALVTGADADRRLIARYSTHFDVAWKLEVQLALAAIFTGIVWGLLWLGASLFALIGIHVFEKLIEHEWFAIPATALAAAAAVHLTDVRASLVRGARTLVLVLLSWLLPLMTVIAAGFVGSLPFTGLAPLWETRHAAALLLTAAAVLIILVNAAYQDGDAEPSPPRLLRYAGSLAALLLVPLVAIAGYALYLRIAQYGWTSDRVSITACLVVAAFYAAGYFAAAVLPGPWLKRIERWNFFASLFVLAALIAIFSPIADPYRISVASQLSRLREGRIPPGKFDFAYLRWDSGRFGFEALHELASSRSGFTSAAANQQLAATSRYLRVTGVAMAGGGTAPYANITVHPAGRTLPAAFVRHDWSNDPNKYQLPGCLVTISARCDAYLMGLGAQGQNEILILTLVSVYGDVFGADGRNDWHLVGRIGTSMTCNTTISALRAGRFTLVPPLPSQWKDVIVNGVRISVTPFEATKPCP